MGSRGAGPGSRGCYREPFCQDAPKPADPAPIKLRAVETGTRRLHVQAAASPWEGKATGKAGLPSFPGREEPCRPCLRSGEEAASCTSCHWTGQDLDTVFYLGQGQRSPENTGGGVGRREPWTGDQADPASGAAPPAPARAPHSTALVPMGHPTLSSSGSRSALFELPALDTKPQVQQPERPWDPAGQLCPEERPTGTRCSQPCKGPHRSLERALASGQSVSSGQTQGRRQTAPPNCPATASPKRSSFESRDGDLLPEVYPDVALWKEASGPWFCRSRHVEPSTVSAACTHGPWTRTGLPAF